MEGGRERESLLTCIHKMCRHSCPGTPRLGEGPLFLSLLEKMKRRRYQRETAAGGASFSVPRFPETDSLNERAPWKQIATLKKKKKKKSIQEQPSRLISVIPKSNLRSKLSKLCWFFSFYKFLQYALKSIHLYVM